MRPWAGAGVRPCAGALPWALGPGSSLPGACRSLSSPTRPPATSRPPASPLPPPRLDRHRRTRVPTLTRVYDSGSLLENISAAELPALFNSEGTTDSFDKRSDNKGPEPEGVVSALAPAPSPAGPPAEPLLLPLLLLPLLAIWCIRASAGTPAALHIPPPNLPRRVQAIGPCAAGSHRRCLFLTTERLGAVFVFDITNPHAPVYQSLAVPPQVGWRLAWQAPAGFRTWGPLLA